MVARKTPQAGHFLKLPAWMTTSFFGSMYFCHADFTSSGVKVAMRFSRSAPWAKVRPK
jgi:hypothetical protein